MLVRLPQCEGHTGNHVGVAHTECIDWKHPDVAIAKTDEAKCRNLTYIISIKAIRFRFRAARLAASPSLIIPIRKAQQGAPKRTNVQGPPLPAQDTTSTGCLWGNNHKTLIEIVIGDYQDFYKRFVIIAPRKSCTGCILRW